MMKTGKYALSNFSKRDLFEFDFSWDQINSQGFSEIAETLLNQSILKISKDSYRITEVEFYLCSANHPDKFTHGHQEQREFGHWYFHRSGETETYKEGKIRGLDLGLGNHEYPLGVLIRGIENLETTEYIDGPSRVIEAILVKHHVKKISDLARLDKIDLSIEYERDLPQCAIISGPRVGLKLKKDWDLATCLSYLFADYRYHIFPCKTKIDRHQFVLSFFKDNSTLEGADGLGCRDAESKKYVRYFNSGLNKNLPELLEVFSTSIEHWCELYGHYCATLPGRNSDCEPLPETEPDKAPSFEKSEEISNFSDVLIGLLIFYRRFINNFSEPNGIQDAANYFVSRSGPAKGLWLIHQETVRPTLAKILKTKPEIEKVTVTAEKLFQVFLIIKNNLNEIQIDEIPRGNLQECINDETFRRAVEPIIAFDLLLEMYFETSETK